MSKPWFPFARTAAFAAWMVVFMAGTGPTVRAATDSPLRFNKDVRPVLSDHCFRCHGPDKNQRKGKLRLDVRDAAVDSGAIVPGKPEASPMIQRLLSQDPEEKMPPPDAHRPLTEAQIDLLKRWVAEGAAYEAHWSYIPVVRPRVPADSTSPPADASSAAKALNPIDAFVGEGLRAAGLQPAPEADRRTLLRRLSLDLTGLPPTPAELEDFERDGSRSAYLRQVERLLASPHFGERMAVPWLDAVRFADTVGYHGDQNQRIFPYRDYVIAAFNRNKGFDAFTLEQIAGDLLPDPTEEQWVATGFNRLNMMTREGGAQPREYLAKYQGDRVRTVSTAWLGSTLACAECHDHKYDPFTMRDFYSMAAFFADIRQWGVYSDYSYTPNPDLQGWSNDHPFPPEIEVDSPYLRGRIASLLEQERKLFAQATASMRTQPSARDQFRRWRASLTEFLEKHPDGWSAPAIETVSRKEGSEFIPNTAAQTLPDGSLRFGVESSSHDRIAVTLEAGWIAAIRLELLPVDDGRPTLRGDRKSGTMQVSMSRRPPGAEKSEPVAFWFADAEAKEPRYASTQEIPDILGGWRLPSALSHARQVGTWWASTPWRAEAGETLEISLPNNIAARVRVSVSPVAPDRGRWSSMITDVRQVLRKDPGLWDPTVQAAFHRSVSWSPEVTRALRENAAAVRDCRNGRAWTQVTVSTNALVTRILPRGNWMDESGPVVSPAVPAFLNSAAAVQRAGLSGSRLLREEHEGQGDADPAHVAPGAGRLDLARWLVSRDNPLTARHFVNRTWAQFFGVGLSARLEDLGLQGEWPTHPELLDWLAAEFMEPSAMPAGYRDKDAPAPHAWDVKHLVRWIVMSSTYRQSSVGSARALEIDPANRNLARQNPRRLDAEMVRDNALAAAGLLNRDLGGPSIFPYQPAGYYANLQFPDRDYRPSPGELQYRRGLYVHWQRTFLHPMLANFDAQSREECVAARLQSNTPQQALTLLNDPTFVEAARVLAERGLRHARRDEARIEALMLWTVGRAPRDSELKSLKAFVAAQREAFATDPKGAERVIRTGQAAVATDLPPVELAAWTSVARVILNLHETITRY